MKKLTLIKSKFNFILSKGFEKKQEKRFNIDIKQKYAHIQSQISLRALSSLGDELKTMKKQKYKENL